jgi:hypothetical protein
MLREAGGLNQTMKGEVTCYSFCFIVNDNGTAFIRISNQIAVHCHYGFNRTGFLIVAYLVEEEKWDVDRAIDEFAICRPPVLASTALFNMSFL